MSDKMSRKGDILRVSVKRGVGAGAGVGVGVSFFIYIFYVIFLSFNPNSDFSQFASAVYRYNIFRCNEKQSNIEAAPVSVIEGHK